jgi:hypothetical protein
MLSATDQPLYPRDRRCPVCGKEMRQGFAYLSAGALLLSKDGQDSIDTDRLRGFLSVGFHGTDTEMRDSSDVSVVDDLFGGQFDLHWCSVKCLRAWLLELLQEVERRAVESKQ